MKVTLNAITQPATLSKDRSAGVKLMNPEEYMIYCARVSSPENRLNHETASGLLKYLIKSGHWSPFEMISLAFEIKTSRAIAQQILRHRSFSFQEFSQRYAKVDTIESVELRYQAEKNRQSSTSPVASDSELNTLVADLQDDAKALYNYLIENNVAKECARMVLPLATQTTIVMHGTLRSWIHFLDQRCSEHAQKEIQELAYQIRTHIGDVCPWTALALDWK